MATAVGIGRFIYTPILPSMVDGLRLTTGDAGLIASANFLGYLAGALAAASPQLRPGHLRTWLLLALALSAVTTGAMGLVESLVHLLWLRFVGGLASAFVLVLASSLVLHRLNTAAGSDYSAVHFAGVGGGIVLSALITGTVAAFGGGWAGMWYGGGLFSLAAIVVVAILVPRSQMDGSPEQAVTSSAEKRPLWRLVIAYGLFGFGYVITATFIVAIVRSSSEIRIMEPYVWLVVGLAAIPSVAGWTMLARRYGVTRAFAIACLVEAIGVVSSVVWISIAGLFVAAAFLGGTFMGITALGLMAARDLSGDEPRRALAVMTAAFGLGQIIGPLVAGYGFDLTGSFLLPSLIAAIGLCISAALTVPLGSR